MKRAHPAVLGGLFMKRTGSFFWKRQVLNGAALCLGDSLVLLAGLLLGSWLVFLKHGIPISMQYSLAVIPVWCAGAVTVRAAPGWGLGSVEELRRIELLLLTVFGMAGVVVFLSRDMLPSRIVYLSSWMIGAVFIPLVRLLVKKGLLRARQWGCPAVVYGSAAQVSGVIESFQENPQLGYIPFGVFTEDAPAGECLSGVPVLGGMNGHTSEAAVAVLPVDFAEGLSLSEGFDRTFSGYQRVVMLPDIKEDVFLWAVPRTLGSLIGLEITRNLLNPAARMVKRGMDLLLILLSAPLWLPLLVLIALVIGLTERENPFFIQRRVGKRNRLFHPVKFRTMVVRAEERLKETLAADETARAEWARTCKLRNDPRITCIGRFLRRTSLDELPQVLNVLAGQMSLVGPRPLPEYHHDQLTEAVRTPRSRVQPGITGLWQVSGRSETGTAGMEKWDTYYVRNWSIWLDIMILARTFQAVIKGQGAY